MITEDYCSEELTKLLLEKGYPLEKVSKEDNKPIYYYTLKEHSNWSVFYYIPTHAQVMKWLRDVYNIHISVNKTFLINSMDDKTYLALVCTKECHTSYNSWQEYHSTFKEAVEAALKYTLKNLIK